jgi:hypothetical protein
MDKPPLFKWRHFAGEIIVCGVRWNWLRVFRSVEASRMGQGGRQQRHTQAVPSEKRGGLRGRAGARMRVSAACL